MEDFDDKAFAQRRGKAPYRPNYGVPVSTAVMSRTHADATEGMPAATDRHDSAHLRFMRRGLAPTEPEFKWDESRRVWVKTR